MSKSNFIFHYVIGRGGFGKVWTNKIIIKWIDYTFQYIGYIKNIFIFLIIATHIK